jgi:hypothetical protein
MTTKFEGAKPAKGTDSAAPLRKSTVLSRATFLIIFQTITFQEIPDDYVQNAIVGRLLQRQ